MDVYCTSSNTGPSYFSDHIHMRYLGTSLEDAISAVGDFQRYEKEIQSTRHLYSALPISMTWEPVKYYMADGWWYTIVKFELVEA